MFYTAIVQRHNQKFPDNSVLDVLELMQQEIYGLATFGLEWQEMQIIYRD